LSKSNKKLRSFKTELAAQFRSFKTELAALNKAASFVLELPRSSKTARRSALATCFEPQSGYAVSIWRVILCRWLC
jgi:hypothetical protein